MLFSVLRLSSFPQTQLTPKTKVSPKIKPFIDAAT